MYVNLHKTAVTADTKTQSVLCSEQTLRHSSLVSSSYLLNNTALSQN